MLKISFSAIMAALIVAVGPGTALAGEIDINNLQLTAINASDSINQVMVVMQFELPAIFDTTGVTFAELLLQPSYALQDGFPMTLGCAPVVFEGSIGNFSFGEIRDSLNLYINTNLLTTASTADSTCDTMRFDITETVRAWAQDSLVNRGLLIVPLERRTQVSGINTGTNPPIVRIKY